MFETNFMEGDKKELIINIICGVLLLVLIVIILWCIFRKKSDFKAINSSQNENKEDDTVIIFFHNSKCPFSQKAENMLKEFNYKLNNSNVKIYDLIKDSEGLGKKYNVEGTPTFVNIKNGKMSVGHKSKEEHEKELSDNNEKDSESKHTESKQDRRNNESNESNERINYNSLKKNKLYVIGADYCGFTTKQYDMLNNAGIDHEVIDLNNETTKELAKELMSHTKSTGIPLLISINDNDELSVGKGFHSSEEELKSKNLVINKK